jgi:hypothetical protein
MVMGKVLRLFSNFSLAPAVGLVKPIGAPAGANTFKLNQMEVVLKPA